MASLKGRAGYGLSPFGSSADQVERAFCRTAQTQLEGRLTTRKSHAVLRVMVHKHKRWPSSASRTNPVLEINVAVEITGKARLKRAGEHACGDVILYERDREGKEVARCIFYLRDVHSWEYVD